MEAVQKTQNSFVSQILNILEDIEEQSKEKRVMTSWDAEYCNGLVVFLKKKYSVMKGYKDSQLKGVLKVLFRENVADTLAKEGYVPEQ